MEEGHETDTKRISIDFTLQPAYVRRVLSKENDLREQMRQIKDRLGEHDDQLNQICNAMENLLDEKAAKKNSMKENE